MLGTVTQQELTNGYVKKSISQDKIATIEFYHPKGNSLPLSLLEDLTKNITAAGLDDSVRVIILRSIENSVFCSGTLLENLIDIKTEEDAFKFFTGFAHVINAMKNCPKFIICAVQGKCIGGGVGLVAAADYAIAVEGADIRLSELCWGIGPFAIGLPIERKMGLSAFSQLAIDAHLYRSADWARRKGLYAELHPTRESMEGSIARLAKSLSEVAPTLAQELKSTLWEGTEDWGTRLAERARKSAKMVIKEQAQTYFAKMKHHESV